MIERIGIALAALLLTASWSGLRAEQPADGKRKNEVRNLTTEEFRKKVYPLTGTERPTYLGDKPAVVDFYADWCGPCRAVAPIMEALADEYAGRIVVYKVNIDREPELAAAFGIRSIPAILFIPKKGEPRMMLGARPKAEFEKAVEAILSAK